MIVQFIRGVPMQYETIQKPMFIMMLGMALGAMGIFASDIYTPGLPAIQADFHTTTTLTQLSVTGYFLGLGLTPLIFGPLADSWGRRPLLIFAVGGGLLGSIICWLSPTMEILLIGRIIQGIGLGTGLALCRTLARDLFEGVKLAQVVAYLSLIMGIAPVIAPLMGSYIQHWFGWRSIFCFLTVYLSIVAVLLVWKMPETAPQRTSLQWRQIIHNYQQLLASDIFVAHAVASAAAMGALIVFFVTAPFIFQQMLHLSVLHYGWVITAATAMSLLSRAVNIPLLKYLESQQIVTLGISILLITTVALCAISFFRPISLLNMMLPAMLLVFSSGLIFSNAVVGAFMPFRHIGGAAGALFGSIQMLGGFIASAIASHLAVHNMRAIAVELVVIASIAMGVKWSVRIPRRRQR